MKKKKNEATKKGKSKRWTKAELKAARMPIPVGPIASEDFKALQDKWYDRLEAKGFKDIEYNVNSASGINMKSLAWVKKLLLSGKAQTNYHHYAIVQEFMNYNETWGLSTGKRYYRPVAIGYVDGMSYRDIIEHARSNPRLYANKKLNLSLVHKIIKKLLEDVRAWGRDHSSIVFEDTNSIDLFKHSMEDTTND